ncbi:methionine sulfoxide reductase B [Marinosulfonomonas sp. PRT-SC04]|nr:methionine sulfoxide reductase B [Marinosulfonomonas sp. PRT-SC04]
MNRRMMLTSGLAATAVFGATFGFGSQQMDAATGAFEVTRTDADWQDRLTSLQYKVMRHEGTERSGSSALDKNYAAGTYQCRGCDLPLYPSKTKFDSGTGWPSFWDALPNAIGTRADNTLFSRRTEVHCRRCGSHLGHIFNDGPKPTGKRHCLNGASLVFIAA